MGSIGLLIIVVVSLFIAVCFLWRLAHEKRKRIEENKILSVQLKEKDTLLEKLKENQESKLKLVQQTILNERTRIAHELHDDTIQRLIAIRFRLEKITWYSLRPEVENEINNLRREIADVIHETRLLIYNEAQTQFDDNSFSELIGALVDKFKPMALPKVSFTEFHSEEKFPLPPAIKKDLYYIVQELVHNSIKHSAATELNLELSWGKTLTIRITDNGIGFLSSDKGGVGSRTIGFRAENIGATVERVKKLAEPKCKFSCRGRIIFKAARCDECRPRARANFVTLFCAAALFGSLPPWRDLASALRQFLW